MRLPSTVKEPAPVRKFCLNPRVAAPPSRGRIPLRHRSHPGGVGVAMGLLGRARDDRGNAVEDEFQAEGEFVV